MNGYEASLAIRRHEQNLKLRPTPILALTADASADVQQQAREAQMDGVITKPFKLEELSALLQRLHIERSSSAA